MPPGMASGMALTYAAAAGASGAIELLQKRGAKPAPLDLMLAATGCHTAAVRVLLASGMKANTSVDGRAPLLAVS